MKTKTDLSIITTSDLLKLHFRLTDDCVAVKDMKKIEIEIVSAYYSVFRLP